MTTWAEETTLRIGRAIRAARGDKSAQAISERTKELGHHISRTAISEYENGKRKTVPVTDLLVLSIALKKPFVLLLFPGYPDGDVELLPGVDTSSLAAVESLSGQYGYGRDRSASLLWELQNETGGRLIDTTHFRESQRHAAASSARHAPPEEGVRIQEEWKKKQAEINDVIRLYGGTVDDA